MKWFCHPFFFVLCLNLCFSCLLSSPFQSFRMFFLLVAASNYSSLTSMYLLRDCFSMYTDSVMLISPLLPCSLGCIAKLVLPSIINSGTFPLVRQCWSRLVPQVAPEFLGFCCIWNRLFSLFLTTKLLIKLLLVCSEQLILSPLFMSGFILLKPC